jgi:hypothetical protein
MVISLRSSIKGVMLKILGFGSIDTSKYEAGTALDPHQKVNSWLFIAGTV